MKKLFIILALSLIFVPLSQVEALNYKDIEKEEKACLSQEPEGDPETLIGYCYLESSKKLKIAVEGKYQEALKVVPENHKKSFINYHQQWKKSSKKELELFEKIQPINSDIRYYFNGSFRRELYKSRYFILQTYIDNIKG